MRIIEIADYSMVIMKDSEDPFWLSLSSYAEWKKYNMNLMVYHSDILLPSEQVKDCVISKDYICTAGKLVMYFEDKIPEHFKKEDKVYMCGTKLNNKNEFKY